MLLNWDLYDSHVFYSCEIRNVLGFGSYVIRLELVDLDVVFRERIISYIWMWEFGMFYGIMVVFGFDKENYDAF